MSRILMIASEALPFSKSGGLADVMGALPPALASLGEDVAVVLPRYGHEPIAEASVAATNIGIWFGAASYPVDVLEVSRKGATFYLVDCPSLYDRGGLYTEDGADYPDNHVRFAVLCRAALEVARSLFRTQIVHCHDWQTALTMAYLHDTFAGDPTFISVRTVQTVHNLGYQGRFSRANLTEVGLSDSLFTSGIMKFAGDVSYLKTGIQLADAITTVSKGYAHEIQTPEYGFGLDGVLRDRAAHLQGILNGVDYSEWDPGTDPHIAANYSATDIAGKRACKKALLEEFGLPSGDLNHPVIGMVSRFATQKGFDLIEEIAPALMAEDIFLTAIGTGEPHFEDMFRQLAAANPGKVSVRIAYDNAVAHRIEAGADMFLMPSHYEPCGLNQIYSLRYGTVPIVRATGGLDDTIDETTGFKFQTYDGDSLLATIHEALTTYRDNPKWKALMLAGMKKDYSWSASATEYATLYRQLLSRQPIPSRADSELARDSQSSPHQ